MIQVTGAVFGFLGVWLMLCDSRNDFAPMCLGVGLLGLIVGGYWGI